MKQFYFLFLLLATLKTTAQDIIINEIQAKNIKTYQDPVSFEYLDWIELKNTTTTAIDLSDYFLTDALDEIEKWQIPTGTSIAPNSYLLIQADGTNTGLATNFKLSSSGEDILLSKPDGSEMHKITYPEIQNDISYGRITDGSYAFFANPTPGEANSTATFTLLDALVEISVPSGIYATAQTVALSTIGDGQIYYTLDGTTPSLASLLYTGAITINTNTVLKAIVIKSSTEYSLVENRSYILGASHNLPVVLLTSDNSSRTPRNKEVIDGRVAFNFIETDGTTVINQYANFEVAGKTSAIFPQLNGKVKADKIYGDGDFDHKMYPDKNTDEFKSFLLRNASQDWANTHLRDAFVSKLIGQDNLTDTPFEAYRPAVLYVNTVYQGIINIREDDDSDYIKHNFDLKDGEFNKKLGQGAFVNFSGLDFNSDIGRDEFAKLVNFKEHISLKLLFAYATPGEWGWQIWEDLSGKTATKFHYNFHDFDPIYGLAFDGANFTEINNTPMRVNNLMETSIKNYQPFKEEAIHFITASINHIYNTERATNILNAMESELESEIPAHAIAMTRLANESTISYRFDELPFESLTQWRKNMTDLKTNVSNIMDANIFNRIQTEYDLEAPIQVTYESSNITQGFIRVHHVKSIQETFTGTYFSAIPIQFTAEALPGYRFVRWEGDATGTNVAIAPVFTTNASIKAIFEPIPAVTTNLVINEAQGKNDSTIADENGEFDDWIEIYNPEDTPVNLAGYYISDNHLEPLKWKIPATDASKTTVAGKGYLLLWADGEPSQGENHIDFKLKGTDQVLLTAPDASTLVQEISFTDIETDTSYGAETDAASTYIVFTTPTPGATNNTTLSTTNFNNITTKISIYPNPTNDNVTIKGIEGKDLQWKLFNITGQLIKSGTTAKVSLYNAEKGIYILSINATNNLKVVKQ